jgi:hypothetical protein
MLLAEATGVSLKTEQRRSHTTVSSFRLWVRRAEGIWGTCQRKRCIDVPVKPRRPPSLPLICKVFPDHSSFSVLRETPVAFTRYHFKKLKCYLFSFFFSSLRIFSGVMGRSLILTPMALYIAFAMAGVVGSSEPSPVSFAPKGPSGSRLITW